jgi:hypothetical protein
VRDAPAVLEHLKRDPWRGFDTTKQSITAKAMKSVGA